MTQDQKDKIFDFLGGIVILLGILYVILLCVEVIRLLTQ